MAAVNPYLTFGGSCEEAFGLYKSVFGGDFLTLSRFSEMPAEHYGPGEENLVMHVALPIGNNTILMGSDSPSTFGPLNVGNNYSVAVSPDTKDQADQIFNGLADGGKVTMPISDAPWGAYFGMLTDKFGVNWMVNFDYNKQ
ncbi:VOC family protein [Chitinophaga vietnamensis]|uniref:VOC family protein n=1 Tax=Chitinophaga vietnamensis TaxID=2593957 RepID=UPI0011782191|nr:VOC family protein [Chitinophaga vietnamensis]